ncbi:MAG TPA: mechanosensitive ion channel family protein [Candidatus Saccharicenans sp.]|jgi:small conductance mechanosensitive channel|nr:mechanosensitive ion channel family protein [Candidatus Saccharicenans sp.]HUM34539.1 mechanosensitive ion channel family protein [Candidatus Saccharicenans sp.]
MLTPELLEKGLAWLLTTGLKILLIIGVALILTRISRGLTRRLEKIFLKGKEDEESLKRAKTLSGLVRQFLNGLIVIIAVMTVLAALDIQIGPLLATAGVAGLAISFAAQSLIKDVINGFFIIFWDQIRVGDVVEIAGRSGVVKGLNLKMTVLRSLDGNVHYIPNNLIDTVTNMTKEYSQFVFDIGVSYFEDVDEVIKTLKEVDEELRSDPQFAENIVSPLEILGLDRFEDSAVIVRARTTTKPSKQWEVGREFNRRLKKTFDRKGISIPFPHLTLFPGQNKQGETPPLKVKLVEDKEVITGEIKN